MIYGVREAVSGEGEKLFGEKENYR